MYIIKHVTYNKTPFLSSSVCYCSTALFLYTNSALSGPQGPTYSPNPTPLNVFFPAWLILSP